ncbi:hypothetical protein BSNK01_19810 [Bacillaceae bacterium]
MMKVKNISQYYGRQTVFSDVSFEIAPNEACAIVGENGAGKPTLLQTILGFVAPQTGKSNDLRIRYRQIGQMEKACLLFAREISALSGTNRL